MVKPPDRVLLSYLASYDTHISWLSLAVREIVLEEAPGAIGFSFTGKPMKDGFCHVVTYRDHVNLGFNRGSLLPDPNRVLEGTGKMIRHVTFRGEEDLRQPFVRMYLRAAIEQVRSGEPLARKQPRTYSR